MGEVIGGCLGLVGRLIALVLGCLLGAALAGLILLVTFPLSIPHSSTASWLSSIGGATGLILFACFAPGMRLNTVAGTLFGALLFAGSGALGLPLFGLIVGTDLVPGGVLGLLLGALLFRPREPGGGSSVAQLSWYAALSARGWGNSRPGGICSPSASSEVPCLD